jgi:hypothetical protein
MGLDDWYLEEHERAERLPRIKRRIAKTHALIVAVICIVVALGILILGVR